MHVPRRLQEGVAALEHGRPAGVDRFVRVLSPAAEVAGRGRRGDVLRGRWLGHALHPLLTDFPLGCWLSAGLLDLLGGKRSRPAAQRLVALGLGFAVPTAAAGLADWAQLRDQHLRRVGAVHAGGNGVIAVLYLESWRSRRSGRHLRGCVFGFTGGLLAWITGYLGGHLSFGRGAGVGPRGGLASPGEGAANDARSVDGGAAVLQQGAVDAGAGAGPISSG